MYIDVFNGDADGICALVQLRLANPVQSTLITGIKREIQLLKQVNVQANDIVTVLDISLAKNKLDLQRILIQGAQVLYIDHHQAGEIPLNKNLTAHINTDANICTSLLVNKYLNGAYAAWAVTAAFGDNMDASAMQAAKNLNLNSSQLEQLKNLGIYINYNGYGASVEDLYFAPDKLYTELVRYESPFDFMQDNTQVFNQLQTGYAEDMLAAAQTNAEYVTEKVAVYILPDAAWSRRISGVYSNNLSNEHPQRAHAILTHNMQGGYLISVRAPANNKTGADELCGSFSTGGGRKGAAGINHLPKENLSNFIQRFETQYTI